MRGCGWGGGADGGHCFVVAVQVVLVASEGVEVVVEVVVWFSWW